MCGAVNVQKVKLFCQYVTQGPITTMVNSNRSTMVIAIGLKDFKSIQKFPSATSSIT